MGMNLKLSSSASGTRNASFNPVVVASDAHVFAMDPSDPTQYYVPGNGAPAVSTATYYNAHGLYGFRCYDLDSWGSAGATAKANNDGRRYVWAWSGDHPVFSYGWRGGNNFYVGFSFQPWDFPDVWHEVIFSGNNFSSPHFGGSGYGTYEFPQLFYNPDDADGLPIYLFAETGTDHYTGLWRSADLTSFAIKDLALFHTPTGTWSSFFTNIERLGAGSFRGMALYGTTPTVALYTSTDGQLFSSTGTAIYGEQGTLDINGAFFGLRNTIQVGAQVYGVGKETASGTTNNQHCTIFPINSTTFDKLDNVAKVRIGSTFSNSGFPGPTYLQEFHSYAEDGILYGFPTYGFPGDVNTTAGSAGRGGAPYENGAGLKQQFVDRLAVRYDDSAARLSAPVGVSVSCVSGTVTISWKDALPQNTYRVYRGTDATTQATVIGDVTGTSTTDSPTTGRYWYKVVTLDSGTERKSRTLSVYVSAASAFINKHINRVLADGGDITTVNIPFLQRADTMLDTVGIRNVLEFFTHPAVGVKTSSSPIKIYDLGTTRLPRGEDFKPTTASTTYSSNSINTGPCWVNANNTAYGYWGNPQCGNSIQRKRQITVIVAYQRTQTTEDITFVGTGPIFGSALDGSSIIALKHTAAGNIEFSLSDATSTKTATVTASGSGLQFAVGSYDGTSMLAYSGTTAGTAVTTLDPNPNFGQNTASLTPGYVNGALAGSRLTASTGSGSDTITVSGFGIKQIYPFLGSGAMHCYNLRAYSAVDDRKFTETNAKVNIQAIIIVEQGLTSTQIGDIQTFLQSTANW